MCLSSWRRTLPADTAFSPPSYCQSTATLLNRPPIVFLNHLVNLRHQVDGVVKRDDETLVVGDVLGGEGAAWLPALAAPVVEPLGQNLVAADVEARTLRVWNNQSSR